MYAGGRGGRGGEFFFFFWTKIPNLIFGCGGSGEGGGRGLVTCFDNLTRNPNLRKKNGIGGGGGGGDCGRGD